jgi:hypothetical protein
MTTCEQFKEQTGQCIRDVEMCLFLRKKNYLTVIVPSEALDLKIALTMHFGNRIVNKGKIYDGSSMFLVYKKK